MGWASGLVVYGVLWWVVFFAVLPWGIRAQDETDQGTVQGTPGSAPDRPRIWMKAAITTGISIILWLVAFFLIESRVIDLHIDPSW